MRCHDHGKPRFIARRKASARGAQTVEASVARQAKMESMLVSPCPGKCLPQARLFACMASMKAGRCDDGLRRCPEGAGPITDYRVV